MASYHKTAVTDMEAMDSGDDAPVVMRPSLTGSFKLKMLAGVVLGAFALCGVYSASGRKDGDGVGIVTDFKGITTLDAAGMDPKVATVLKTMSAWGKGLLHGDNCEKIAPDLWTQDAVFDARGISHPSNMWRVYTGIEDGCKWLKNLELMDFSDFEIHQLYPGGGDTVLATVKYTPALASGAKKASHKVEDAHIWTVRDGKVAGIQFLWAEPDVTSALFADDAPTPTKPDDQMKFLMSMFAKWGQGKFHGDACHEEAKLFFADDIVIDATGPMTHTSFYHVYTGLQEFCTWIAHLEEIPFKDFKIPTMYRKAPGVVVTRQAYTISDTKFVDYAKWTLKDGKISATTFVWSDVGGIDKFFATLKMSTVQKAFGAWGKGLFHGDKCLGAVPMFYSEDFVFDVRAPMKNNDMWKMYKGYKGVCDMLENLELYDLTSFSIDNAYPGKGNQVIMSVSYKPKLASDDGPAGDRLHDGQIWTVKGGKIVRGELLMGQPRVLDSLLGPVKQSKPDDDMKLVQNVFVAWGAGKFHGDGCQDASKYFFTDDTVVDASAPMENTDMMTVYRGTDEMCNKWIKNLEQLKFKDFTPTSVYSKSPGTVVAQVTYGLGGDDAHTTFVDTQEWTVTDGKISKFKILWGNTKAVDKVFGAVP